MLHIVFAKTSPILSFPAGHGISLDREFGVDGNKAICCLPYQPDEVILPLPLNIAGWLLSRLLAEREKDEGWSPPSTVPTLGHLPEKMARRQSQGPFVSIVVVSLIAQMSAQWKGGTKT